MKYCGKIGFVSDVETAPDVYEKHVEERFYVGDVLKNNRRWVPTSNVNDDISISNVIKIVADPFACVNLQWIRYAEWMGALWKVTDVEYEHPHLKLTIGGVYNAG